MSILIDEASSLTKPGAAPMIDLSKKGQQGALRHPITSASSARYVRQRMVAVLISEPALFRYMEDADKRTGILRSLIEDRAISFEGINSTRTANFGETVEGNSGEVRETHVRTTIERSVPSANWPETAGRGTSTYWAQYIDYMMGEAETGIPLVAQLPSYVSDENALPVFEDNQSFSVLFFEPSADFATIIDAVLVTGMMPKSSGEIVMKRAVGEDLELPEVAIEFTGQSERGPAIFEMAVNYLAGVDRTKLNPDAIAELNRGVSANVEASREVV